MRVSLRGGSTTGLRAATISARLAAATIALARLARAARTAEPIAADASPVGTISVVVPARDEAARIGPLLERVIDAPGVGEVLVVDDESTDATAAVARIAGATVVC